MILLKMRDIYKQACQVHILRYLYLNYFCKNVQRCGKGKIIPYKGAVINLEPDSRIVVGEENIQIGTNKLRGSKAETYIRLRTGAHWNANGRCLISYGATIEVLQNAVLETGYFSMNSFSVLIAAQKITIGQDVMIGRNVVIYDSDFHKINSNHSVSKPVCIQDHVWIASNAMVLKGVEVGAGAVIAANTLVTRDVSDRVMVAEKRSLTVLGENVDWQR